jgi:endonuclease/exonuclease/phosphatase family metal-dependent hydrolase
MRFLLLALGVVQFAGLSAEPVLGSRQIHAIVGEPRRVERTPPADGRLTVVSWNIEQGVRYERVRDVLRSLDADVYLLQEVDMGVRRSNYRAVASELARDLDLNWVFAGEFQEIGQARGDRAALTGQAVLSRYPIYGAVALRFENQAALRWKLDPFQPRRGGRMALRAESGGMLLYNAHIESAKNESFRHKQIDEMLFDYRRSARTDRPVIFAGDFNTEQPADRSPVIRALTNGGFVDALGLTDAPRRTTLAHDNALDWIFIRNMTAELGRVIDVRQVSDHFPLEAAVSLQPPASALVAPVVRAPVRR